MSMTSAQQSAWNAGVGGNAAPADLNLLILGCLFGCLLLFAAWSLLQAYRGVKNKTVRMDTLAETAIRLVLLILLSLFFYAH
ncbi:TIGR03758 family integrating conjugative element protein [Acerihabitans arboris]|uniref:TIGR03758 family integrating conjugative element protein n=1 Tax=Acerihabitans arboris TaxID=2691583 RepID=A0A845SJZ7_9GAMM|nr:TIGR03758 family integrating conjugative element protein [Acerihabitans arboris]NDL64269.1 TIGR03758 family integrating conjugative element protein [Acerihabitans arboris]